MRKNGKNPGMISKSIILAILTLQVLVQTIIAVPLSTPKFSCNERNNQVRKALRSKPTLIVSQCRGGAAVPTKTVYDNNTKRKAAISGLKNSLASALGAVCSKTALAPFDTIKTIQQEHISTLAGPSLRFFDAARMVMERGNGVLGFYAGLGVAAIGAMPSVGLYFGIYSYSKGILGPFLQEQFGTKNTTEYKNRDAFLRTVTIATSAAIGNTVASISRVPYEVLKQKLQMNQYPNTWVAITSMITSSNGKSLTIKPFFPLGGISSQMARDIPYAIFTLLTYEYLRDNWVSKHENTSSKSKLASGWWKDMVAGAVAGGVGSYLTNPMDVIKTRLQTSNKIGDTSIVAYTGVWDCAQKIYLEEGPRAFLKGSIPRLMHKVPANAIFFLSYEVFRRLLNVDEI